MKKAALAVLFIPLMLSGQNSVNSRITEVIVYQQGAKISNEATASITPGNNEINVQGIPENIDANSIQVKIYGDAVLLSANFTIRQLEDKDLPKKTKMLEDSINSIYRQLDWLGSQKTIYEGEERIITDNQKLGTQEQKVSVEEIIQLSKFYRERLFDIRQNIFRINNECVALNEKKEKINGKLNELRSSEKKTAGEIIVNLSSKKTGSIRMIVSYLSYQAGWTPIYDVRAEGADKPITLLYKANVYQSTGYSWDKVKLTVSTGNPASSKERPQMFPWYINFYTPQVYYNNYQQGAMNKSAAPSMENALQRSSMEEYELDDAADEPAPVIGYAVTESSNQIAAEYAIDADQDIPSDGKAHLVAMKEYELNSRFTYHAIPKLDPGTFLLAKIADYGQYNLLPGQANLFLEGMYIGQSYLNPVTTVDSMFLSLGQDSRINIKRNVLQNLTSRQDIGPNVRETKAIEMSIRNNSSFPIELDLMDQIPIAQDKDIEVKLEDGGGAKFDQDYGSLLWKLKLNPGETKKVKFVYSVKYPKDKSIYGL